MYEVQFFKRLLLIFLVLFGTVLFLSRVDYPDGLMMTLVQGLVSWVLFLSVAGAVGSAVAIFSIKDNLIQTGTVSSVDASENQFYPRAILTMRKYFLMFVGIGGGLSVIYIHSNLVGGLPGIVVGFGAIIFLTLSVLLGALLIASIWSLSARR